jgi:signal transduction histidine kinase
MILLIILTILGISTWNIILNNQYIEINLSLTKKEASRLELINNLNYSSLDLNSLDKQRSEYIFLFSHNKISKEYKKIKKTLTLSKDKYYIEKIKDVDKIIEELDNFKNTMKLRNDYLFHKKTLQTILNNNISTDYKSFSTEESDIVSSWELLKDALNSSNLITLGELRRKFNYSVSGPIDSINSSLKENRQINNIASGANGVFSTSRNIFIKNIKLEEHIYNIQKYSSVLIKKLEHSLASLKKERSEKVLPPLLKNQTLMVISVICIFLIIFFIGKLILLLRRFNNANIKSIGLLSRFNKIKNNLYENPLNNIFSNKNNTYNEFHVFVSEILYKFLLRTQDIVLILDKNNNPVINSDIFNIYIKNSNSLTSHYSISNQNLIFTYATKVDEKSILFPIDYIHKVGNFEHKIIFLSPPENESKNIIKNDRLESLGKISGEVAHDINNMLSVIIGSLNILRESKYLVAKEDSRVIDKALFSADKSISIIDRLLTFACCQKLSPELVDVNDLIEGLYEVICFTSEKHTTITLDLSPDVPILYIDPGQLEACIINLCINAMNAIDGEGHIIVKTSISHSEHCEILQISVDDNGHGIPKNIQTRIFEPFFTGQKKTDGQGLGLSMAYGFIKQSGGYINVYSKVGLGTTMSLVFELGDNQ